MKLTVQRVLIFFLLIGCACGFGLAYDGIAGKIERKHYPRPDDYAALIRENADAFGVPEAILWSVVRTESNFVSSKKADDGSVGLMQLQPELFTYISTELLHESAPDAGLLYDPASNLRAGAAYLSTLYGRYGLWDTVFAAWSAGTDAADGWMSDPELLNGIGVLVKIPDRKAAAFVAEVGKSVKMYTKLYYES